MNGVQEDNPARQTREEIPSLPESEVVAAQSDGTLDDPANREATSLSSGFSKDEIEQQAATAEHGRSEKFRNHFERLAVLSLYLAALLIIMLALTWFWHLVVPQCWRWLGTEDISHIQSIVTAGLLVGVIGNHFKKRLG